MQITIYHIMQDDNLHPELVAEAEIQYAGAERLSNPEAIVKMLNEIFEADRQFEEHVWLITVNADMKPLGLFELSHGSLTEAFMDLRSIYTRALLTGGASGIEIAHNHPSHSLTPSEQDLKVCKRLVDAGDLMGIPLLDFIIIGGKNYNSFRETTDLIKK